MLIVAPGLFRAGELYRFRAIGTQHGKMPGFSTFNVLMNSPPAGGRCDITPLTGQSHKTTFSAVCRGWADDDDGILRYSFGFVKNEDFTPFVSPGPSYQYSFSVAEAGNVMVEMRVYDEMGAYTSASVVLNVTDSLAASTDPVGEIETMRGGQLSEAMDKGTQRSNLATHNGPITPSVLLRSTSEASHYV